MKYNMKQWFADYMQTPVYSSIPILSFPAVQKMGVTVKEYLSDSDLQSKGMKMISEEFPVAAVLSPMDLSVEAETFGCEITFEDDEVPNVVSSVVGSEADADSLVVPEIGSGRTGVCIDAVEKAVKLIDNRPVFAGIIGPFSLAGRLMDVSETMIYCFEEPDMVHKVMRKATDYLVGICRKYRDAGAHGIVMAEPLTGILSPSLADEFSHPYVREIVKAVQSDDFAVIYHNCGNNVVKMSDGIFGIGAMAYHFGNSIRLSEMLALSPSDIPVMGNVDPSVIANSSPDKVRDDTLEIMKECCSYPNFCISSGCDIPPKTSWENLHAFFETVEGFEK